MASMLIVADMAGPGAPGSVNGFRLRPMLLLSCSVEGTFMPMLVGVFHVVSAWLGSPAAR